MPSYRYEAATATGHIERGLIDAENERNARQLLRSRGLLPLSVQQTGMTRLRQHHTRWGKRLSDAELGWVTRQLASLLAAGLPLETALSATLEQSDDPRISDVLAAVRADVRAGHRLCDAMAAHPRDFPDVYRALIDAGEQSGDLSRVMERLAEYIESRGSLRSKILTSFIYPVIVIIVATVVVFFLLSYVVPQVVGAFQHARQTLPWLTRALLFVSGGVQQHGLAAAALIAAMVAVWRLQLRRPAARLRWHARVLRLPLVGRYVAGVNTARYAATLAILTGAGVPLLAALDASARTLANDRLRLAAGEATALVREGSSLAGALRRQKVFPPLLIHLIDSGERTGKLPAMLERASQTLSAELERRALAMTALLEPLMTLVMGGIVLLIVLAIMLPVIEVNQLIR